MYINNMSVITDLQLMFATFGILFSKESTQGVENGQVTAVGENYVISGVGQSRAMDYDEEKLRASSSGEIDRESEN